LRTSHYTMQSFVRAIKQIAMPEQVKAYRRHRPYVHYGPAPALPVEQDLYGAWTASADPLTLYLTPCALVMLAGEQVRRVVPLEQVQDLEVMRRIDDPESGGVVRFRWLQDPEAETFAYTLPDYVPFGAALAEAAKRSLEDPPLFYGKKKEDEDDL
ncbi:MAG: hypothetical protein K8J31_24715, partial [Anaerolineae bacterium]|nr:hypothetical protein [Anaerolineae bacterium]